MDFSSSEKGCIAEAKILAALVGLGYQVLIPWTPASRYDVAIDLAGDLVRIQCKLANKTSSRSGVIRFYAASAGRHNGVWTKANYRGDCDLFICWCPENDQIYAVPVDECPTTEVTLRLVPAKNNQACRMADDHKIEGVLAQLGERHAGSVEVASSSLAHST